MKKRRKLGLVIAIPSLLALGLIAWGGYWAAFRIREGGVARAELVGFLAKVSEGRLDDAYRSAAPELRCRLSLGQFRGLAGYYGKLRPGFHAEITMPQAWPHYPLADIDVSTHYDQDIPHHAALVKLGDGWRVAWIDRKPAADVQAADRKCGERSMHIAMIRQPLLDLLAGFEIGNHRALADRFHPKQSRGPAAVAADYAHLKPKAAALKEALSAEPVFEHEPAQGRDDRKLAASLRAHGVRFSVRANFVLDGDWKLMLFEIDAAAEPN
jgi:hypothetical protein